MRRYLLRNICIICQREFELVTPKQQTCSSKCAIIHMDNFLAERKLTHEKVTKDVFEKAKSSNGGWSKEQLKCFGIDKFFKGWQDRIIGSEQPKESIKNFIDLKDKHFDVKPPKKSKPKKKKKLTNQQLWFKQHSAYLRSAKWQTFRQGIIAKRGRKCESCGETKGEIHCHHLNYIRVGNELPTDVRLLCKRCHEEAHGRKL